MKKYSLSGFLIRCWVLLFCLFQMVHFFWADWEIQARDNLLFHLRTHFSDAWRRSASLYGIFSLGRTEPVLDSRMVSHGKKTVLLISGLDDPGYAWQELGPVLTQNGFSVFVFIYPNDQSMEASTDFLYERLAVFSKDSSSLALVCHSMGGLLAWNLLTRPDLDYPGKVQSGARPRIDTLITVGTPHKGSQLARFRIFLEIRDLFYQVRRANVSWLHGIMDGTGSAGIQLLPGSSFLQGLHQRSLSSHVSLWKICGRLAPFSGYAADCLGDGLVSIDSAQGLFQGAGSPVTEVSGSHMGMLRKPFGKGRKLPSAIPVILNILSRN